MATGGYALNGLLLLSLVSSSLSVRIWLNSGSAYTRPPCISLITEEENDGCSPWLRTWASFSPAVARSFGAPPYTTAWLTLSLIIELFGVDLFEPLKENSLVWNRTPSFTDSSLYFIDPSSSTLNSKLPVSSLSSSVGTDSDGCGSS